MRHGLFPVTLDKRDFSFHRTFGATVVPVKYPDSFSVDLGKTMPDQVADGYPEGCRAYTQTDDATDEDKTIYKIPFTCNKIAQYEGTPTIQAGDIRDALAVGQDYGMQALAETTDQEAETHRRGIYLNIYDDGPTDWFNSFRTALIANAAPISMGTPWFGEWESTNNGIVTEFFNYDGTPSHYSWHNWAIKGWMNINGYPYLLGKSWQGPNYGDKGWCYFSRETINKVMEIQGSAAFISLKYTPANIQTIQISLYQTIILYLNRIIGILNPLN